MAGGAACGAAVRTQLRHALAEFAVMRILVAARTTAVFESVGNYFRRVARLFDRVAIGANHRHVCPGQRKAALLVLRDRICRRLKPVDVVALLALIAEGGRGKLPLVYVGVTVQASGKSDLVARRRTRRNVTFRARNRSVLPLKRVLCARVLLHSEK